MSGSANVHSIQTLRDFKLALIAFGEDARNALGGVDMDLRRMRDWLERDQLGYWQMQVKRRSEEVMQARADLHRRKISQQGSDAVSDSEQKEALREATKRLRVAEEKVALIKRLVPQLTHAIAEYHSHSQPLGDNLSGSFERSLAVLEKMVLSLEAYVSMAAPSVSRLESTGGGTGGALTTTSGGEPGAEAASGETETDADADADGDAAPSETQAGASATAGEPAIPGRS